jgi:hypothetical protein
MTRRHQSRRLPKQCAKEGGMDARKWDTDPEHNYRCQLLAGARQGKATAKEELQTEYHVRLYTAAERKKLQHQFNKNKTGPDRPRRGMANS